VGATDVTIADVPSSTTPPAEPRGALEIGPLRIWPPVVLAPMAGITNAPFRRLCQRFATAGASAAPGAADPGAGDRGARGGGARGHGAGARTTSRSAHRAAAGMFVSEMITARGLVERNDKTLRMARFAPDEPLRSIQLYGTDPSTVGGAVRMLVADEQADHVDLNFGCPVAKVTRKGGGSALPVRRALFGSIIRAAVDGAGDVPVTVKVRLGVDEGLQTFLDAGRIAEDAGAAAVALHARTAEQHYSGRAAWERIAELKAAVTSIPVLGNGDVWAATDALAMVEQTGCDGVVVGRGCLGRPWLFRDLATVFAGGTAAGPPPLGAVVDVLRDHARLLADWLTEPVAVRDVRKHVGWYLQGYPVGGEARRRLTTAATITQLEAELDRLDPDIEIIPGADTQPRGKTSGPIRVVLPDGWLAGADDPTPLVADELDAISGG
jgi:nifR3 family TIM-barrel protein